jgi:3-methyladenine DNA glycosylase AlkD
MMPTARFVLAELKKKGQEKTRITYARHRIPKERCFGVSVADLKVIAKSIKRQQALAYELYDSGMMEAMYLAGMVADGSQMNTKQLDAWAEGSASITMIAEYTVPWVTVENPAGRELALR